MRTVRMPRRSRPVRGRSNRSVRACWWHRMVPYAEPGVRAEGRCRCCDQGRSLRPPVNNGDVPSQTELRSALRTSAGRSEEHTSELQSLMRISYAVFCLKKKNTTYTKIILIT